MIWELGDVIMFWEGFKGSSVGGRSPKGAVIVPETVLVIIIVGNIDRTCALKGADMDKGGEGEGGEGGKGETRGWGGKEGAHSGGIREPASQDGGAEGASSMVVLGRRVEGKELRCLMNMTWKELNTFPVMTSQRQ